MRRPATIAGLALVVGSLAFGQDAAVKVVGPHAKEDEAAIQKLVVDASEGRITFDVEKVMSEYADDAYFINAFGIQKNGKPEIKAFATRVLARDRRFLFGVPGGPACRDPLSGPCPPPAGIPTARTGREYALPTEKRAHRTA